MLSCFLYGVVLYIGLQTTLWRISTVSCHSFSQY